MNATLGATFCALGTVERRRLQVRLPGGETTSRGLACSASLAEPWSDTCPLSSPSVSGRLVSAEFRLQNLLPMVFACLPGS